MTIYDTTKYHLFIFKGPSKVVKNFMVNALYKHVCSVRFLWKVSLETVWHMWQLCFSYAAIYLLLLLKVHLFSMNTLWQSLFQQPLYITKFRGGVSLWELRITFYCGMSCKFLTKGYASLCLSGPSKSFMHCLMSLFLGLP